jgi:hypothetical protein
VEAQGWLTAIHFQSQAKVSWETTAIVAVVSSFKAISSAMTVDHALLNAKQIRPSSSKPPNAQEAQEAC